MAEMIRASLRATFARPADAQAAGLLFARGMRRLADQPTQRGEEIAAFLERVASQTVPPVYLRAYRRWLGLTADPACCQRWIGRVDGRLFVGLGEAHVLETNLTFSRPYGMPMIPGSTLKGLAHAQAKRGALTAEVLGVLFGRQTERPDENDAGYLIFHDAWWVPESAPTPLAREVVTVHHPDYYSQEGGTPATDFDSPNPNAQLAARGAFLFVVEGTGGWATLGLALLRAALVHEGIGGKTAAGYGYFVDDPALNKTLAQTLRIPALGSGAAPAAANSPESRRQEVQNWDAPKLADLFGKNYNKTRQQYGEQFAEVMALVRELHRETLAGWAESPRENERKAFKRLQGDNP
ncbi:MAG: type III-B CRISPR module RAMP protein Cmr6 [Candidatus Contendobacter sp.]|nr:type III-B CRISPR module RAMP protein Cmr6 [Candidatus Contendobacter sp.]MDG4557005.1 type III-B CRISPR module RAMP protein Cmr6 [Candidatus Contendobacter sp.]